MNKFYTIFFAFLLSILLLAGCAGTEQTTEENQSSQTEEQTTTQEAEQEETVAITISENNGEKIIAEETIPIEEGEILFDVMKENFEIKATEDGLITSIEGVSQNQDEGKYWLYQVNGEMAEVGAKQYELEAGDEITFDLHAME